MDIVFNKSFYPKVLLFGHSFTDTTGLGITLTNLFANWPREQIAIMANHIDVNLCERIRPCALYIGHSKFSSKGSYQGKNNKTILTIIKQIIRHQYHKTGINELMYKPSILEESLQLAQEYNPDIVFCCLGSLNSMRLCAYFMDKMPKAILVLYIVDDWVNTKINCRYFSFYWRRRYDNEFRKLLNRASGCMSICQYMSDAYLEKYGKKFYPFHNPVDLQKWNAMKVDSKYPDNVISILYIGKINDDTRHCIVDMSKVVENINKEGYNIVFDVYSPDYYSNNDIFYGSSFCNIFAPIAHADIPIITKSYSALFLPLGFNKHTREYVRLSMPTKLSEYLASGLPIILYCPAEIALAKYLSSKECAIVCTENNLDELKEKVSKLNDCSFYADLVSKSLKLAEFHDVTLVRKSFRNIMYNFIPL